MDTHAYRGMIRIFEQRGLNAYNLGTSDRI